MDSSRHEATRDDCYDNAATESVANTIKVELIHPSTLMTRDQARLGVFSYIEGFCNPLHHHSALGHLSPMAVEEKLARTRVNPIAS